MNLRDFFRFRRSRKDSDDAQPDAEPLRRRELRNAWRALETEDFDTAAMLGQEHVNATDGELALESKKIVALAQFRKEHYSVATPLFQEIANSTNDVADWFNVVTSATLSDDINLGEHAFQQCLKCQESAGHSQQPSVPFMRQFYACALRDRGEFGKALEQIEELRSIYEQLKITDDTFVYIRGVPFLSHTMDVAIDVFRGMGDSFDPNGWIDSFASKLDDDGREYLQNVKERIARGN
ncbi:MAG: hypothetical protein OSA89_18840 [Mariniblastus sp.]|nr:hypothetical protein [Mariniblastus sp.]